MKGIISFLLSLSAIFISMTASAQRVSFESRGPLNVASGDRFRIEFVLNNASGSSFTAPTFDGVKVLAGPTTSTGSSTSWINGVSSSATTETYTYFIEAQSDVTKASITGATIMANGEKHTAKTLAINILPTGQGSSGRQQGGGSGQQGGGSSAQQATQNRQSGTLAPDDIMLRMELSKRECFKGEAVSAQLKLYTRVGVSGFSNTNFAAFNGIWTVDIETPQNAQSTRATINGKVYESYVLRQWLLYPQRAGTITIEQNSLTAIVQVVSQNGGNTLFDQFFGGGSSVNNIEKNLTTGTTKLVVKSLPAGAPVGSSPMVGDFRLSSTISAESIAANSAGSLSVTLEGSGDFPLIELPDFKLPAEFEQYDTKTDDKLRSSLRGQSGSRTWEFPFIARSEGSYTIPSIEVVCFNPKTGKYTTLRTPEYPLEITRDSGDGAPSMAVVSGVSKEDLKMLGQDIHYIKTTAPKEQKGNSILLYSATFYIILLMIALGVVALLMLLKKQAVRRADVAGSKNRKASKIALKRLKIAKKQLDANARAAFFEEMLRAMWGFVGDKFGIEVSELNKSRIEREFAMRNINEQSAAEFIALIEECEMAQYAPSAPVETSTIYNRALSLFDTL